MNPRQVYQRLYRHYGPQGWWPADSPFEVMIGAILTQNTAWSNVEKAIHNLRCQRALTAEALARAPHAQLASWIRPSGYFNIKAERLKNFCNWYLQQGGMAALQGLETDELRHTLLGVKGIGPETADDILLYAFARPVFVIDAYTRRLFARLQLMIAGDEGYETLRHYLQAQLSEEKDRVQLFNEYHALIVIHAKEHCRKRPLCDGCPLSTSCAYRQSSDE